MGTLVELEGGTAADTIATEEIFATYEATFSPFRADSELTVLNRAAGSFVRISSLFQHGLREALRAARLSDGLVVPTVGGALVAAGLYEAPGAQASATRTWPGQEAGVVTLGDVACVTPGVVLDLNGIVKALAVDAALEACPGLRFVSAGGDLAARAPLNVGVPGGDRVRLVRGAIATSGSTRRRWLREGKELHHLIDPATGRCSESPWREVSACGATCVDADIAAKAGLLAGADGPEWLDERGVPGRFVDEAGIATCNETWVAFAEQVPWCP
jgi:thiamine biosynthesis lipoprotein